MSCTGRGVVYCLRMSYAIGIGVGIYQQASFYFWGTKWYSSRFWVALFTFLSLSQIESL